jgi:hypothetical protein
MTRARSSPQWHRCVPDLHCAFGHRELTISDPRGVVWRVVIAGLDMPCSSEERRSGRLEACDNDNSVRSVLEYP